MTAANAPQMAVKCGIEAPPIGREAPHTELIA